MLKLLLTLAASSLLLPSAGAETARWKTARGATELWLERHEENRVFLERFRIEPGRFQRLLEHHAFDDKALADREFRRLTRGFSATAPRLDQPATEVDGEVIWPVTQEWSRDWEKRYSDWVGANVDADFFVRHRIPTDCADVPVALRWIFARMNGLPALNHLMGSGALFSNESVLAEWKNLPTSARWEEDPRFRAALEYVMVHTYTHSIMRDLYPVQISPEGVGPGAILLHLYNEETGHTELVRWTGSGDSSAIKMLASNVPREVRTLLDYGIQDWGYPPEKGRDGLLRWLWPVRSPAGLTPLEPARMPLYSLEQYQPAFTQGYDSWTDAVVARAVPHWTFDPQLALRGRVAELLERLRLRVKIVADGYAVCSRSPCREGTAEWETWSTPSRDAALARLVDGVQDTYMDPRCHSACQRELNSHRRDAILQLGWAYTLNDALQVWLGRSFSSDPNDEVKKRWGW